MKSVLISYIREVLSGFSPLNATGPDRALGNIRQGDATLGHQNKGLFADLADEEGWGAHDEDSLVKDEEGVLPSQHGSIT